MPSVWVAGELQRLKSHANGHLYFELVEKGDGALRAARAVALDNSGASPLRWEIAFAGGVTFFCPAADSALTLPA